MHASDEEKRLAMLHAVYGHSPPAARQRCLGIREVVELAVRISLSAA
jgi:hypothetical protein